MVFLPYNFFWEDGSSDFGLHELKNIAKVYGKVARFYEKFVMLGHDALNLGERRFYSLVALKPCYVITIEAKVIRELADNKPLQQFIGLYELLYDCFPTYGNSIPRNVKNMAYNIPVR